jgi:hypothetical protein
MKQGKADADWERWGRDFYIEHGVFSQFGNEKQKRMNSYVQGKDGLLPPKDLKECKALAGWRRLLERAIREEQCRAERQQMRALVNNYVPSEYCTPFRGKSIDIPPEEVHKAIGMSYHIQVKPQRSGGTDHRGRLDIMYDNLQGKLAEIIVQGSHCPSDMEFKPIDFDLYDRGIWDPYDIVSVDGETEVSVKSGLNFHQMLLLPCDDYDETGRYKHHQSEGDTNLIYAYVRMGLSKREITKNLKKGQESFTKWFLNEYKTIEYDVFFCPLERVQEAIKNGNVIKQGAMLNGATKMDATNYYLLSHNMERDINQVC